MYPPDVNSLNLLRTGRFGTPWHSLPIKSVDLSMNRFFNGQTYISDVLLLPRPRTRVVRIIVGAATICSPRPPRGHWLHRVGGAPLLPNTLCGSTVHQRLTSFNLLIATRGRCLVPGPNASLDQWGCELVDLLGSDLMAVATVDLIGSDLVADASAWRMRRKETHLEHYLYGVLTSRWLLIRFLLQSHSILSRPLTPVFLANFTT